MARREQSARPRAIPQGTGGWQREGGVGGGGGRNRAALTKMADWLGMRASLCPALTWCAPRHIAHSHHPPAHTCCSRTHNHQPAERDNQSNSNQNKFHAHTLALARLRAWRTSIELTTNTGGAGQTMPAPGNPRSKHTHPQRKALHPPRPVGGEAARAINGTILRRATPGLPACFQAARQQP